MKTKRLYKKIIITFALFFGASVFAQTTFNIDDGFFTQSNISSGDYSILDFNYGGNSFQGIMFLGTGINQAGLLTIGGTTIICDKQLNGLYLNPARGNRLRPLDQNTLNSFSGAGFTGYNQIILNGGLFTECTGTGINTNGIYGYVQHQYMGVTYNLWAGVDYNFGNNLAVGNWSGTLNYITGGNITSSGYIFDANGGIAKVHSNQSLFGNFVFTGTEVNLSGSNRVTMNTGIKVNIMSNKNAQFEITGNIVSILTGNLTGGLAVDKNILLTSNTGTKQIYLKIFTGGETIYQVLNLTLYSVPTIDNIPPVVSLILPSSGTIITGNYMNLVWSGYDNVLISNYKLYVNGASTNYMRSGITTTGQMVGPIPNSHYNRYVIATDTSGNTGQSQTRGFTISGSVLGPILISPASGANVNIGQVSLLRQTLSGANSGYNWQISSNTGFTNIVISGNTNNTGTTLIHNPTFMTGTYYWRVIDKKTAGISEHRTVNIVDLASGVDIRANQFMFNDITGANLSDAYVSNTINISGLSSNVSVLAKLENNIGALFINNVMVGSQGLVRNSDQVKIELISSSGYNNMVSAKLLVGTGADIVSGTFRVYNKSGITYEGIGGLSYGQKLQAILFVNTIAEMYKNVPHQLAQFLTTFKAILKDKSDLLANEIYNTNSSSALELLNRQKDSIDYLYLVVDEYLKKISYNSMNVYIAPNGKQYLVEFNNNRFAYTSPDFVRPKFFPTWELFTQHIDTNNPGTYRVGGVAGDTVRAPNNIVYNIYVINNKWTSNQFKYKKYFDTRDQIIEHIMINNPASSRDHTIDTNFTPVLFVAPNGRQYTIFKTSSSGNNANKFSSFNFVTPKYFNTLQAAQNHINQFNR